MSRSRKRSRQSKAQRAQRIPTPTAESLRSKKYTAGKAVKYAYRIHGPKFPVQTMNISDLPERSKLI